MKVDISRIDRSDFGLAIGKRTPEGVRFNRMFTGGCKAYLWDYLAWNINGGRRPYMDFGPPSIEEDEKITAKDETIIGISGPQNIEEIAKRLYAVEDILGIPRSEIFTDKITVIIGSPNWKVDVVMFSLFLGIIRFYNAYDRASYHFTILHPETVVKHFEQVKDKLVWPNKNADIHGTGFNQKFVRDIYIYSDLAMARAHIEKNKA